MAVTQVVSCSAVREREMATTTKVNPHVGSRSRGAAEANVYAHPSRTSKAERTAGDDGGRDTSASLELMTRKKKVPTGDEITGSDRGKVVGETSAATSRGDDGGRDDGDRAVERRRRGNDDGASVASKMAALLAEADATVSSLNMTSKEKWTKNNNSHSSSGRGSRGSMRGGSKVVCKGVLLRTDMIGGQKGSRSSRVGTGAGGASISEKHSTEDVLAAVDAALNASRAQTASRPVALRLKGPSASRSVVAAPAAGTTTTASDKLRVIDNVLDDLARTLPSRLASSSSSSSTSLSTSSFSSSSSSSSGALNAAPAPAVTATMMMMTAPCRGIVVGVAESSSPSTVEFTRDALSYDFLKHNTRERVRMTMYYRDMMDVRLEEEEKRRRQSHITIYDKNNASSSAAAAATTASYVLSFRLAKPLDRFMGLYVPSNPSHRLSIGFVSTEDAVRCGEEVLPLMRRGGRQVASTST